MSSLELFVAHYPLWTYAILFLGMFIEGELFFLTVAIFATQGYLELPFVVGIAFFGVVCGDTIWYYLGLHSKKTKVGAWIHRKFVDRYHAWLDQNFIRRYSRFAVVSKFIYYVNRLTPLLAGWHKMELRKFLKIHLVAAAVWILIMTIVAQLLGVAIQTIGVKAVFRRIEFFILGIAAAIFVGEYILSRIFSKRISVATGPIVPHDTEKTTL